MTSIVRAAGAISEEVLGLWDPTTAGVTVTTAGTAVDTEELVGDIMLVGAVSHITGGDSAVLSIQHSDTNVDGNFAEFSPALASDTADATHGGGVADVLDRASVKRYVRAKITIVGATVVVTAFAACLGLPKTS